MQRFFVLTIFFCLIATSLVSAGFMRCFGKKNKQNQPSGELVQCRKCLFDKQSGEQITPQEFMRMLAKLHEAYSSCELEDTDQNKELVSSWIQLTKLNDCSDESLEQLYQAQEKSYDLQNVVWFIKWKREALEKKCDEDKMLSTQTTSINFASSNEQFNKPSNKPTKKETSATKMSQPKDQDEIQELVHQYEKVVFDKSSLKNVSPDTLNEMISYLYESYYNGSNSDTYDHYKSIYYLHELAQFTKYNEKNFAKFDEAIERDRDCPNIVAYINWQREEFKKLYVK